MLDQISSEFFSSLIHKMNQTPNVNTPSSYSSDPQIISSFLTIFNIDSSNKSSLSKLFKNLNSSIKDILYRITVLIYTKFSTFNLKNENTLNSPAVQQLINLCSSALDYFKKKMDTYSNYESLRDVLDLGNVSNPLENFLKELISFNCGLVNIMIQMFKRHFSLLENISKESLNENLNKVSINGFENSNNFCKDIISKEVNMLFIISKSRNWLEPLIGLLEQVFKIILNNNFLVGQKIEKIKKLEKENRISKSEIKQRFSKYFNVIDDKNIMKSVFTVVKKYYSVNNLNDIFGNSIRIGELNDLIQKLFNIYIVVLMNMENICKDYTDEEIYCLANNVLACLTNAKFIDANYGVDFSNYFYTSHTFIEEVFDLICKKLINSYSEIVSNLRTGFFNYQGVNLNLLQCLENTLKDYIAYVLIASYNKDSLCDSFINCENNKKITFTYGLLRSFLIISRFLQNIHQKDILINQIFNGLLQEAGKNRIIFPIKFFVHKNYLLTGILIILHNFVRSFSQEIISSYENNRAELYERLSIIKEFTSSLNCLFFLLSSDILLELKIPFSLPLQDSESFPIIRLIDESDPMNYSTFFQNKISKPLLKTDKLKPANYSKMFSNPNPNSDAMDICEDKENSALFSNSNESSPGNRIEREDMHIATNSQSFFQRNNKSPASILTSGNIHSSIFQTEVKKKTKMNNEEFLYRYDITSVVNKFQLYQLYYLNKIGYEVKNENNKTFIYINDPDKINVNQVIYLTDKEAVSISICNTNMFKMLKKDPFNKQIIEQLYVCFLDGVERTNKGKNCEANLKYYDIKYEMNYFQFVEKCKEFLQ